MNPPASVDRATTPVAPDGGGDVNRRRTSETSDPYRVRSLAGFKPTSGGRRVVARHPLFFPYLKKHLTTSVVEEFFSHLIQPGVADAITRFTLPGIHGLNFVLQSSLGGGGVASLRSDPQGKAFGQMLLDVELRGLPDLKSLVE
ncbi:hypothetical protein F2P81_018030 [Scophthalmus maximus]|uniref:AtuA-like ferredoxin-fold domain-containing protein n=1 Tax=Scophthalmus maximus TaxID=52904 RepID=A0A6A4S9B4_SCOMX|nr:hypothetical protein F2P81_018030 [Scophthalmus maximus]